MRLSSDKARTPRDSAATRESTARGNLARSSDGIADADQQADLREPSLVSRPVSKMSPRLTSSTSSGRLGSSSTRESESPLIGALSRTEGSPLSSPKQTTSLSSIREKGGHRLRPSRDQRLLESSGGDAKVGDNDESGTVASQQTNHSRSVSRKALQANVRLVFSDDELKMLELKLPILTSAAKKKTLKGWKVRFYHLYRNDRDGTAVLYYSTSEARLNQAIATDDFDDESISTVGKVDKVQKNPRVQNELVIQGSKNGSAHKTFLKFASDPNLGRPKAVRDTWADVLQNYLNFYGVLE